MDLGHSKSQKEYRLRTGPASPAGPLQPTLTMPSFGCLTGSLSHTLASLASPRVVWARRAPRRTDWWPCLPLRVVSSWIERRKVQSEKANLIILFDKYLPTCLDKLRIGFKRITPVPEITVIQTILYLLECLLTEKNAPPDSPKELYELYFVFACFWAFGGAMFQDQVTGTLGTWLSRPGHPATLLQEPLWSFPLFLLFLTAH